MRVVLDTNTVLSALLFPRGRLSWISHLWTAGRILPLVCSMTARELIDVLAYQKFKLNRSDIQTLLAAYLPFTETIDVNRKPKLSLCRDPDDQIFLVLAAVGRAEVLVSGGRAVVELAGRVPFTIETAAEFRKRFTINFQNR
ncbi:MAG: putative toxin-antitoxin system toxin component, PIN family [Acidobacteriota bacterium]